MKHHKISWPSHGTKLFFISAFAAAFLAMTATSCEPQTKAIQGSVWIANEGGNSLTVVDAGTSKVITTLTGIEGPHNVQLSPDSKTVWAVSGHKSLAVAIESATYKLIGDERLV